MIARWIALLLFVFTGSLQAAQDLSHPLTISELVAIGLENNPETRQAWWNAKRAAAAVGSAESDYYPYIHLSSMGEHGREFKYLNGPDVNYTFADAQLVLDLILYDFGKTSASVDSAKMVLLAANWQNHATIQKVMLRILENAYNVLHAQEVLQAEMTSLAEAEKMLGFARELNRAGLNPISDFYTSQATYSQMQMDVAQYKADLDIKRGKLAASLGFVADITLTIAPLNNLPSTQKDTTARLIALAYEQRADLMAKQAKLCESYANLDKAKAEYTPTLSLVSRGGTKHYLHDKSRNDVAMIAIGIDIPLFAGFDSIYQKRMALAETQMTTEELAQLELEISLEVLTSSRNLEATQEMLCYAQTNLDNAQKAYEAVLEKYRVGKERIAEVSNALQQLSTARVRSSNVKTRYLVSIANLAYATGIINNIGVPCTY